MAPNKLKPQELNTAMRRRMKIYLDRLDSLLIANPIIEEKLSSVSKEIIKDYVGFIKTKGKQSKGKADKKSYRFSPSDALILVRKVEYVKKFLPAIPIVQRSLLIGVVSQFDAFYADLIKSVIQIKPELFQVLVNDLENDGEVKNLLTRLSDFKEVSDFKKYIIAYRIDQALRKGRIEQLKFLEKVTGISKIAERLTSLPQFIELNERRNLFTHTDGLITEKYINACKNYNILPVGKKVGDTLDVDTGYIIESCKSTSEVCVELGYLVWKQLLPNPDQPGGVYEFSNELSMQWIKSEKYDSALRFVEFQLQEMPKSDDQIRMYLELNKAQIYKWTGRNNDLSQWLTSRRWESYDDVYKLAYYVLKDNYTEAVKIMKKLAKDGQGDIDMTSYSDWPIFKEFVKSKEFNESYKNIYKKAFMPVKPTFPSSELKINSPIKYM